MRLLLVEDDARIAADIAAVLTGAGYSVETARDGEEALGFFAEGRRVMRNLTLRYGVTQFTYWAASSGAMASR